MAQVTPSAPTDFIREIIEEHFKSNRFNGRVATRFPPEPNGYIHIGHAKSVCLNFGIAAQYKGTCNLRMERYGSKRRIPGIRGIDHPRREMARVRLGRPALLRLGLLRAVFQYAVQLIKIGKAYVCDLGPDEIREYRGTLTQPR